MSTHWQSSQGGRRLRNHWQSGGKNAPGPGPGKTVIPDVFWFYGLQCSFWIDRTRKQIRLIQFSPFATEPVNLFPRIGIPTSFTGETIPLIALYRPDALPVFTGMPFQFGDFHTDYPFLYIKDIAYTGYYPRGGGFAPVQTGPITFRVLCMNRSDLPTYATQDKDDPRFWNFNTDINIFHGCYFDLPDTMKLNIASVTRTAKDVFVQSSDYADYSLFDLVYEENYEQPVFKDYPPQNEGWEFPLSYGPGCAIIPKSCTKDGYTLYGSAFGNRILGLSYDAPPRGAIDCLYNKWMYTDKKTPEGQTRDINGTSYGMTFLQVEGSNTLINWSSIYGPGLSFCNPTIYPYKILSPVCRIYVEGNENDGKDYGYAKTDPIPLISGGSTT